MRIDYFIVFMKNPGKPYKIGADNFMDFLSQLQNAVANNGPFELIYRG